MKSRRANSGISEASKAEPGVAGGMRAWARVGAIVGLVAVGVMAGLVLAAAGGTVDAMGIYFEGYRDGWAASVRDAAGPTAADNETAAWVLGIVLSGVAVTIVVALWPRKRLG